MVPAEVSVAPSGHIRGARRATITALLASALLTIGLAPLVATPASAADPYTVTATVGVGSEPNGVAVDSANNSVYVANLQSSTVSVVDEGTDTVTATIPVPGGPDSVAVDDVTDTVYVTQDSSRSLTVIDGSTNTVTTTVATGQQPEGVAVDSAADTIYVANTADGTVSVIDGGSNTVIDTIGVGSTPVQLAFDAATSTVYCLNWGHSVSVIDAASRTVTATIPITGIIGLAINAAAHEILAGISTGFGGALQAYDTGSHSLLWTTAVGTVPMGVAVDQSRNIVYVPDQSSNSVDVVDGAVGVVTATVGVGATPIFVANDAASNTSYVGDQGSGSLSVIAASGSVADAPTIGAATGGPESATVSFTPPGSDGGTPITSYTVTATDVTNPANGAQTASGPGSPITVAGLTDGDSYTFTVVANNGAGTGPPSAASNAAMPAAAQTVPPAITSAAAIDVAVGGTVSFTVAATGTPIPSLSADSSLPGWLTFTDNGDGTATISGTAPVGSDGSTATVVTAANGTAPDATQTLTVNVVAITSAASTSFGEAQAGSFTVSTSNTDGATFSETGALPNGVTFTDNDPNAETATLAGTPAVGTAGTYPLTVTMVADGVTVTQSFVLTVVAQLVPLTVTSPDEIDVAVGGTVDFTVTTTGSPVPSLSDTELPSWLTFTDNGDGTATIAGTAPVGSDGTTHTTITATNGVEPDATPFLDVDVLDLTSAPAATFVQGRSNSFTVTNNQILGTYSVSGALPGGVTFTDNEPNALTATLSGTPAAGSSGTYPLTITFVGKGITLTQSFVLTVTSLPVITSPNEIDVALGGKVSFTVTSSGSPTPTLSAFGTLPKWLVFKDNGNGTATISGTAPVGSNGTVTATITAHNLAGFATQTLSIEVLAIVSATSTTFTVGQAGAFTVATNAVAGAYSETGTLPSGVTFVDNDPHSDTATLSGTPATGSTGTYPLTITFVGKGVTVTQKFMLTVTAPPAFTSSNQIYVAVGGKVSFKVTTTGSPVSSLTTNGTLPTWLTFKDNGNGTATISGTAPMGSNGTSSSITTAHNSTGIDATQTLFVNVLAITSPGTTTFTVGQAGSFTVTDDQALGTFSETGALPNGVTFTDNDPNSLTATLAGTPATGTLGSYPITIHWLADGVTVNQAFTLKVVSPPVITSPGELDVALGGKANFSVTTTGSPAPAISANGSLPKWLTLKDNGNGTATISGTAPVGSNGTVTATITARNASGTVTQTLYVEVVAIISPATTTFNVGQSGSFTVITNAVFGAYSETGALPSGVTFVDNDPHADTATLSGTPAAGSVGTYPITVTFMGKGVTVTQSFVLKVTSPPAITSPGELDVALGGKATFTVTTTGSPAPAISANGTLPKWLTLKDNGNGTATISGIAPVGSNGTVSATITAHNASGTVAQTLYVEVLAITSPGSTTFTVGQPGTFTVTNNVVVGGVFTETGRLPNGVTFVDNDPNALTATLAGTPATGTAGTYPILITLVGKGVTVTQKFVLKVTT